MTLNRPLSDGAIIARVEGHASALIDGETVIMSGDTGRFHVVAATGASIWERLATPKTVEQLITELAADFDVSLVKCREEVEVFLASLAERNLVTIND